MSDAKEKDIALWKKWKATRSSADLQALLDQMKPIIMREVNKWAPSSSRSLLESEGKRLAVEAFESYNPNAGTALSTYLTSRLIKMSRTVYSTQNSARLSETKTLLFNVYHTGISKLTDQLGRPPADTELADHLGWSLKKLRDFNKQANRKEFVESEEHSDAEDDEDMQFLDLLHHGLSPLQQQIFEYSTGYRGKPKLSGAEIMKKLNITQGVLSYQKALLVKYVEDQQKAYKHE